MKTLALLMALLCLPGCAGKKANLYFLKHGEFCVLVYDNYNGAAMAVVPCPAESQ